jgi:capsular exopolysaccharide synthesis family protein
MNAESRSDGGLSGWRAPMLEQQGLRRYVAVIRERYRMIIATVAICVLAAVAYVAVTDKTYRADADLLVTPLTGSDDVPTGLSVIRESNDPTRDVETVARLVTTRDVAARVRDQLGVNMRPQQLLDAVQAAPVAQSNIVSITAEAHSPRLARDIANGFGRALVQDRTEQLHVQLDRAIARLRQQIDANPGAQGVTGLGSLSDQLSRLEALRAQDDPTIRLETPAAIPGAPSAPRPVLSVVAGFLVGLVLGVGGAFALHAIDPRLRREDQLHEGYRLPVLARIPRERKARTSVRVGGRLSGKRRRALSPGQLSPVTQEAFRTLRAMLDASRGSDRGGRSVLITGASPSEGKTTTAINLAASLALAGYRVILLEADFRRPTIGETLGVRPRVGISQVLLGHVPLEKALVSTEAFGEHLQLLLVHEADPWLAEVLSLPTSAALLEDAKRIADFVIVDSPPLTEVIDALPLAQQVDDVVLVVRIGTTNLSRLSRLGDLLAQNGIRPTGFAVVGVGHSDESSYYLSTQRGRMIEAVPRPEPSDVYDADAGEPTRTA